MSLRFPDFRIEQRIIALNQIDDLSSHNPQQWLSFSLSPEDEARRSRTSLSVNPVEKRSRSAWQPPRTTTVRRLQGALGQARGNTGTLLVDDPADTNQAMGKLLGSGSSDDRIRAIESAFDLPLDAAAEAAVISDVFLCWHPILMSREPGGHS